MRFWAKLAPILGIIGWLMASSGQGSLPEVLELVKQWTGISTAPNGAAGGAAQAPGIAQLAGMFGLGNQAQSSNKRNTRSSTKRKAKSASGLGSGSGLADAGADIADILRSATGSQSNEDWQDVAQGYVKKAVAKAAGLDWLFGGGQAQEPQAERRRTR